MGSFLVREVSSGCVDMALRIRALLSTSPGPPQLNPTISNFSVLSFRSGVTARPCEERSDDAISKYGEMIHDSFVSFEGKKNSTFSLLIYSSKFLLCEIDKKTLPQ